MKDMQKDFYEALIDELHFNGTQLVFPDKTMLIMQKGGGLLTLDLDMVNFREYKIDLNQFLYGEVTDNDIVLKLSTISGRLNRIETDLFYFANIMEHELCDYSAEKKRSMIKSKLKQSLGEWLLWW